MTPTKNPQTTPDDFGEVKKLTSIYLKRVDKRSRLRFARELHPEMNKSQMKDFLRYSKDFIRKHWDFDSLIDKPRSGGPVSAVLHSHLPFTKS